MTDIDDLEDEVKELDWKIDRKNEYFEKQIKKIRETIIVWDQLTEYTIPYSYERKLRKINSFLDTTDLPDIIKAYRKQIASNYDSPHIFNQIIKSDRNEFKDIIFRNSTFLKNAKIFYDISKTLYWDTRPILSYYSSSYLLSFFINSIVNFHNLIPHHGLRIRINNGNENNIEIIYLRSGSFQRIVKTFSFISYGSIFSDYLIDFTDRPINNESQVEFYDNKNGFSIENKKHFLLKDLLNFISESKLDETFRDLNLNWIHEDMQDRYILPSILLKNYILIFVACNLSRYHPLLWKKIYEGESSEIFLHFQNAIENIENMVSFISDEFRKLENKTRYGYQSNIWRL